MADDASVIIGWDARPFELALEDPARVGASCAHLIRLHEPGEDLPPVGVTAAGWSLERGGHGLTTASPLPADLAPAIRQHNRTKRSGEGVTPHGFTPVAAGAARAAQVSLCFRAFRDTRKQAVYLRKHR